MQGRETKTLKLDYQNVHGIGSYLRELFPVKETKTQTLYFKLKLTMYKVLSTDTAEEF
jgi:hypothetical protein